MTGEELWACYGWLYPEGSIEYEVIFGKKPATDGTADPLASERFKEYREWFLTHQLEE